MPSKAMDAAIPLLYCCGTHDGAIGRRCDQLGEQLVKRTLGHSDGSMPAICNRYDYVKEMQRYWSAGHTVVLISEAATCVMTLVSEGWLRFALQAMSESLVQSMQPNGR